MIRTGARLPSERVILYVAPGEGPSRAALVAPGKIGGAVARNRARRILREAWRAVADRVEDGHLVVVVATRAIEGASTRDVTGEMRDVLAKAGVTAP